MYYKRITRSVLVYLKTMREFRLTNSVQYLRITKKLNVNRLFCATSSVIFIKV